MYIWVSSLNGLVGTVKRKFDSWVEVMLFVTQLSHQGNRKKKISWTQEESNVLFIQIGIRRKRLWIGMLSGLYRHDPYIAVRDSFTVRFISHGENKPPTFTVGSGSWLAMTTRSDGSISDFLIDGFFLRCRDVNRHLVSVTRRRFPTILRVSFQWIIKNREPPLPLSTIEFRSL